MSNPNATLNIAIPDSVYKLLSILETGNNGEARAYIVGGCVRDKLLGITPKDWDVCTSLKPDEVKDILASNNISTYDTGIKHGTVTAHMSDMDIEITTFRIDGDYSDNRHPDSVEFANTLYEDLARRDFTINAMAVNKNGILYDPYNGLDDLKNRIIRCVGNPEARFTEDALRVLRALRFSTTKDMYIDDDTVKAMYKLKDSLTRLSSERLSSELCKMLGVQDTDMLYLNLINYHDILSVIIPDIKKCVYFNQNNKYHAYNVWAHTCAVVANTSSNIYVRLAALFHDIGKPDSYTEDSLGYGHFYGHPKISADITLNIMTKLKFSNEYIKNVYNLVLYHDSFMSSLSKRAIRRTLNKFEDLGGEKFINMLFDLRYADIRGRGKEDVYGDINKLYESSKRLDEVIKDRECFSMKDLAVNGNDMIELEYEGKGIGAILNHLLDKVISGELPNDKEILMNKAHDMRKKHSEK